MNFNSDGMTGSVGEVFSIPLLLYDISCSVVDVTETSSRPNQFYGLYIGFQHCLIDLPGLFAQFFVEHGSCHVRSIVVFSASDVQNDGIAFFQQSMTVLMMRIGSVFPVGDDGCEGESFRT